MPTAATCRGLRRWASSEAKSGNLTEYADEMSGRSRTQWHRRALKQKRPRASKRGSERVRWKRSSRKQPELEYENARAMAADDSVDEGADGADASPEEEDYREARAAATVQAGFRGRKGVRRPRHKGAADQREAREGW